MFKLNLKILGSLLSCIALSNCASSNETDEIEVFLSEPGPGPLRATVLTQVTLNCTVRPGYRIEWHIQLPEDPDPIIANSGGKITLLHSMGIEILPDPLHVAVAPRSRLVIRGTAQTNGTRITCGAVDTSNHTEMFLGRQVKVTFHNLPVRVGNLVVVNNGPNSLNLSWTAYTTFGTLTFTVTAMNLNVTIPPVIVTGITKRKYTFTIPTVTACDTYGFQVTAVSQANVMKSSERVTAVIPSVPSILIVQESLTRFVTVHEKEAILTVSFNAKNLCPTVPILKFTLFLGVGEDRLLLERAVHPDPTVNPRADNMLMVEVKGLWRNTEYWYYIVATNKHGHSKPTIKFRIITSQLREITICKVKALNDTYTIHCHYIPNSTASGCFYTVGMSHGTIVRSKSSDSGQVEIPRISDYTTLQGYAIGDTRNVTITRNLSRNIQLCAEEPTKPPHPLSNVQFILTLTALPMGLVVFIILIWLLYCIVYEQEWLHYRCTKYCPCFTWCSKCPGCPGCRNCCKKCSPDIKCSCNCFKNSSSKKKARKKATNESQHSSELYDDQFFEGPYDDTLQYYHENRGSSVFYEARGSLTSVY